MFTTGGIPSREAERDISGNKQCPRCAVYQPLAQYHKSSRRAGWAASDGTYRQSYCRACQRADRRRQQRSRNEKLAAIKSSHGCADCGFNGHPAALDFHHASGDKDFQIGGNAASHSWATVLREAAKCVVLCANCHRIRHATPN